MPKGLVCLHFLLASLGLEVSVTEQVSSSALITTFSKESTTEFMFCCVNASFLLIRRLTSFCESLDDKND